MRKQLAVINKTNNSYEIFELVLINLFSRNKTCTFATPAGLGLPPAQFTLNHAKPCEILLVSEISSVTIKIPDAKISQIPV